MVKNFHGCEADAERPFFVTWNGESLRPEKMLAFIEKFTEIAGDANLTKAGVRKFGKHSFRSTGAVQLAQMGLEVSKIQIIGRWLRRIVLRYCRDAPLKTTALEYKMSRSVAAASSQDNNTDDTIKKKHINMIMNHLGGMRIKGGRAESLTASCKSRPVFT